jgi:predicted unusual protein kinase regulating ubiquinone biosynthesis (AarF/ABC1/UbiB family)
LQQSAAEDFAVSLLPTKLRRYAAVATLLMKFGRAGSAAAGGPLAGGLPEESVEGDEPARQLAADLEQLGPTFVKLGQLLSTRADLLPSAYLRALERLQDRVEPFAFEEVRRIVEADLGTRLAQAFGSFDEAPIAAASLGQVHRASLRDGRAVAVKVQRPGIVEQVRADVETLEEIAALLEKHSQAGQRYNVAGIVQEFKESLAAELDYRREADNLRLLRRNLAEFAAIVIPSPVDGYTTPRVLTMDYVDGTKVTALHPLTRIDIDARALAETLVSAYLRQIVIDGVFHADPHPGNVLVTADGRLALVDLGMVGRISPAMQDRLLKLLLAVSAGRGDEAADVLAALGEKREGYNESGFRRDVSAMVNRYGHETLAGLQVGRLFVDLQVASADHHLRAPSELTLLGKTLLNLDQVARVLDPSLDVNAAIGREAAALMTRRLARSASGLSAAVFEAKEFAERLPSRVNRVLDALAASELRMKVELIDEGSVLDGLQKIANRITLGLVIAALIVGAAMVMQVPTSFRLFGYPGLAMILFMIAATAGLWLAWHIVAVDRSRPRH